MHASSQGASPCVPSHMRPGLSSGQRSVADPPSCCLVSRSGEDLLVASADKPFRFPATFTFVVRSFTVLDGIGKGLDPRFDISEIAAPYARSLLLEASPAFAQLQTQFGKRLRLQARLLRGPPHCSCSCGGAWLGTQAGALHARQLPLHHASTGLACRVCMDAWLLSERTAVQPCGCELVNHLERWKPSDSNSLQASMPLL